MLPGGSDAAVRVDPGQPVGLVERGNRKAGLMGLFDGVRGARTEGSLQTGSGFARAAASGTLSL